MKKQSVGNNISMVTSNWNFENIENTFDNHINKSIPFYQETHKIALKCSEFFNTQDSFFLDIGCSTGTLIKKFRRKYDKKNFNIKFLGLDTVPSMIKKAKKNNKDKRVNFMLKSIIDFKPKKNFNYITSIFTLQFINAKERQKAYDKIYSIISNGGAFVIFEKVLANNSKYQDIFNGVYNDFKRDNNFSEKEISLKSLSLRGKLDTFTSKENSNCLKKAGFRKISVIFKWFCFEGYLCVK